MTQTLVAAAVAVAPRGRRLGGAVAVFAGGCLAMVLVVEMLLGALLEQRAQHDLLHDLQAQLVTSGQRQGAVAAAAARQQACATGQIVSGCRAGAQALRPDADDLLVTGPLRGRPIALLQIPRLHLSQVVVEGARPEQTRVGPGHVPGTTLPGQAGNAGIVGRRTSWGAVFRNLGDLRKGDRITVTTAQGQSTYGVDGVGHAGADDPFSDQGDDRLTLATADPPLIGSGQLLVRATLLTAVHPSTPRGSRDVREDGTRGDPGSWPLLVVLLQFLGLAVAGTVVLYRRWHRRSTYLLSTPVILALAVLTAQAADSLLPATL